MEEEIVRKRGKYTTKKRKELESLLEAAKEYKFERKVEKTVIKRNPATIAEFTKDVCIYPAVYLNHDNTCVKCTIVEHCVCPIRNLGKKRKTD